MNQQFKRRATLDDLPRVSQTLNLVCQGCGHQHAYDVGTILCRTEGEGKSADMQYAFSNYFRCRDCDAAGPWKTAENWKVFALTLAAAATGSDKRIVAATPVLFDGTTHQSPAMGECDRSREITFITCGRICRRHTCGNGASSVRSYFQGRNQFGGPPEV